MQRSIAYPFALNPLVALAIFAIYEALCGIYLFLPPMLSVLFFMLYHQSDRSRYIELVALYGALLLFEAQSGALFLSTILFYHIVVRNVYSVIEQHLRCKWCKRLLFVMLVYLGYALFSLLLSSLFLLDGIAIGRYLLYYIFVEFLIVGML